MNNRIKAAFNSVYASDELKSNTRAFIAQKSRNYTMRKASNRRITIPAVTAVCAAIALFAGIKLYFTPTTHINIDINPSIDLGINRFDRVVTVNALNDDGKKLMETLDIKFAAYDEALRRILDNKSVEAMLSEDEIMTVTVIETNSAQSENILSAAKACASGYGNVHCHSASIEEASAANRLGLSYEKYLTYLELLALDPEITPEEIRNMTMREIRDLTAQLTGTGGNHHYEDPGEHDDPYEHDDHNDSNDHNEHNDSDEYDDRNEHNNSDEHDVHDNYSSAPETGHHGNGHGFGHE